MPASSKAQYMFMQAVAHGMKPKGNKKLSAAKAREYVSSQPSAKGLPARVRKAAGGAMIFGAQDGADTTDPTALDFSQFIKDDRFKNLLLQAQAAQALKSLYPQPSAPIVPPIGDVLQEQGKRQELAAGALPGGAYRPGAEPGGLYDAISSFIGQTGGPLGGQSYGPGLSETSRRTSSVPYDTLGTGGADALALADEAVSHAQRLPGQEVPAPLQEMTNKIIQGWMDYLNGQGAPETPNSPMSGVHGTPDELSPSEQRQITNGPKAPPDYSNTTAGKPSGFSSWQERNNSRGNSNGPLYEDKPPALGRNEERGNSRGNFNGPEVPGGTGGMPGYGVSDIARSLMEALPSVGKFHGSPAKSKKKTTHYDSQGRPIMTVDVTHEGGQ